MSASTVCGSEPRLSGYGTIWQYCDPWLANETWVTFLGTKDVKAPKRSRSNDIDTTENDGSGWESRRPGPLKKLENVQIQGNLLIEQYDILSRMFEDDITTRWRQVLQQHPQQPVMEFCAYIADMEEDYPMRDLAKQMLTLAPTGSPNRYELNPA